MKYKTKSIVVDAIQFNGNNTQNIIDFINKPGYAEQAFLNGHDELCIRTHTGIIFPCKNNFIVKDIEGEIHVYKPNEFKRAYELIE